MASKFMQALPVVGDVLGGIATNITNSIEASKNRNFQAQQAQLARDWQEDMYNQYSSPSAMVQQYKEAGLNPAMMYGSGQSTGPNFSTSSPSGAQATMINPADNLLAKFQSIAQLKEMIQNNQSQRDLQSAQANAYNSQVGLNNSQIGLNNSVVELNKSNISKITQEIEEIVARTNNLREQQGLIVLEKTFKQLNNQSITYDNLQKKWEKEYKDKYGYYPAENEYQAIQRIMDAILTKFGFFGPKN